MMRSGLCAVLALGVCGCSEVRLDPIDAEFGVSPPLLDFGTVSVGGEATATLTLDSEGGEVKVISISVLGAASDSFSYGELELPLTLERNSVLPIEWTFNPQEAGFPVVMIELVSDAEPEVITVHARGEAVPLDLTFVPASIDFGPVGPGETEIRPVTVKNEGEFTAYLIDAIFSNDGFWFDEVLPIELEGGTEKVLDIGFTAATDSPQSGIVTFRAGSDLVGPVHLRANDCENGSPAAYDQDGDGYSMCGGDCDDLDAEIRPGGVELPDGVDQDCDGIVDEGTTAYDDDGDGLCEFACTDGSDPGDCNDGDPDVNPNQTEILGNGIDDDCDGIVDLGTDDFDGDGYSVDGGDCDDNEPSQFPGNTELPDSLDNNCDGFVDEGTVYFDDDGDGFCEGPICTDGSTAGDCDDRLPEGAQTFPFNPEVADWQDNNCNGIVDEGTNNFDNDGDGYTVTGGDCDDGDALISPAFGNC